MTARGPVFADDEHALVSGWVAGALSRSAEDLAVAGPGPTAVSTATDGHSNYVPVVLVMAPSMVLYRITVERVVG